MKRVLMIALVLLVAAGVAAGGYYWYAGTGPSVTYKTAKAERGDLSASISATGTLEPEEVVDVGAQVAGIIQQIGRAHV
jgi:HlyD family secretion protein